MQDVAANENFRHNLRAAMTARGVSHGALAEKIKSARPYVTNVLSGKHAPAIDRCEQMAHAVGFELRDLLLDPKVFSESLLTSVS